MADIAKFGIEVDPKDAVRGSDRAKKAIREVGNEAERTEDKVVGANKRQGQSARRMARTARGAFGELTNGIIDLLDGIGLLNNGFGSLIRRGQNLAQSGQRMTNVMQGAGRAGRDAASGAAAAAGGMGAAGTAAAGAGASLGALLPILAAVAAAFLAIVVAVKATGFVFSQLKRGVALAAEFQKTQVAVETLVGSTSKMNQVLGDLRELSDATPLSPKEVQDAGRTLLAFGSSTETVVDEIRRIGDVAQGVQAPLGEIATLYGKARVQGTLFAEDINQLTNRGIPVISLFAAQLGVSESQVKKLGSQGKITFDNLEQAFITMTSEGGKFQGMMERTSQTFAGRVSTLSGLWDSLVRQMGEPIRDALAPVLDDLIGFVRLATPVARAFGEMIAGAIKILYQAVSDGQLASLLGTTFMAGVETLLEGLFNAFKAAVNFFAQLWVSVVEFAGTKVGDFIGGAFAKVANFFSQQLTRIIAWFGNQVAKLVTTVNSALPEGAQLPLPGVVGASGPVLGNFNFEPDRRSFGDFFKGNEADFVGDVLGDVVGTTFRDAAAKQAGDLIERFNAENPGLAPLNREPAPTRTVDGTGLGAGGAGGGAGKAAKKAKEAQDQLSENTAKLLEDMGNIQQGIDNIVAGSLSSFSNGFTDAFTAIATGSATASEAFSRMATQIIGDITRMIIQMTVQLSIQRLLGIGGFGGNLTGFIGGLPTAHSGGLAGNTGLPRSGNGGLATFHSGGISSSETAVKVDRNETILTRRRSEELEMELTERRGGSNQGGQQAVQILNVTDPSQVRDAIAANPDMIVNAISRRMPAVRNMIMDRRRK